MISRQSAIGLSRRISSSRTWATSGIMISGRPSLLADQLAGRLHDGAYLHQVDLGIHDPEPAAAQPEAWGGLVQGVTTCRGSTGATPIVAASRDVLVAAG